MSKIESFLNKHHTSLSQLSKKLHLPTPSLKRKLTSDVNSWSSSFLKSVAQALNIKPGQIIDELTPVYELKISNHSHTIQGIAIQDAELFEQVRFVVEAEHLEGWQPTSHDIQILIEMSLDPNNDFDTEIERIWGELDD